MRHVSQSAYVIGIDEVGRGALAGAVTVAAVAAPRVFGSMRALDAAQTKAKHSFRGIPLRDSKRLSKRRREAWCTYVKRHPLMTYAVASVSPAVIDRINVSRAANRAAAIAVRNLLTRSILDLSACRIFLDGGLYLNTASHAARDGSRLAAKTVVKGDERVSVIALASIVAKVTRDRRMRRLHERYPQYGFDRHVGYGTRLHRAALERYGPSEIHRLTFLKKYGKIASSITIKMPRERSYRFGI